MHLQSDEFFRGGESILFIDDDELIVNIGKNMLEHLGYQVVSERNPVKALEIFKERPEGFDLIITDMTMPKMTGTAVAEKIMKIRAYIPIIICTGYSDQINEEKAKRMGIKKLIMKPFVMRDLAGILREVLDEK